MVECVYCSEPVAKDIDVCAEHRRQFVAGEMDDTTNGIGLSKKEW